jgi:signal transduction histidine kinase
MDVAAPVWQGQLGTVHVGVSRQEAVGASNRMQLWMCAGLGAAVFLVLTGAQLLAAGVSRPLRELDLAVSQFPSRPLHLPPPSRFRTSEIDSLFRAIGAMARRLTGLEQDRAATVQRMVNAERLAALGQLAAGLAHEIHNPLDGMLECLAYLDADPQKSSRAAKYYPMLRDGLQRIAGTMRQMLSFARTGSEATCELSPVTDVVESLSLLVRPKLEGHRVRLIWEGDPGCACECDRNGLSQAGLNLVLNAAEAAENSADPCVRVRTRCDQKWVYLSVEDSGPGVPEALRSRIFEPFFTTRPPGRGTGLGLSVSRETIRACGGEIELAPERSPLGGAVFVIRVPRAADGGRDHGSGSSQNPHR